MEPSSTSYRSLTQAYLRSIFDVLLDSIPGQMRVDENHAFTGKGSMRGEFSTVNPADEARVQLSVHRKPDLDFFQFEVTVQSDNKSSSQGFSITDDETVMSAASKICSFVFDKVEIPLDVEEDNDQPEMHDMFEAVGVLQSLSNEMLQEYHEGSTDEAIETCRQIRETFDQLQMRLASPGT